MIKKITELDRSYHYEDLEGKWFSRIVAGLSFPKSKPGFVVVLAEDYYKDQHLRCRHLRALAEVEEPDMELLLKKCLDLRERYWIERIIGDTHNEPMMDLLYNFNRSLEGAPRLTLYSGAFPDDLSYHTTLIKNATRFNNKTIHLNQCHALRGHLSCIAPEDAQQGKVSDHPAVMALGFVISHIKAHPRDPLEERIRRISNEKPYNPLTYGLK